MYDGQFTVYAAWGVTTLGTTWEIARYVTHWVTMLCRKWTLLYRATLCLLIY